MKGDGSITEQKDKDGNSYTPKRWRVVVPYGKDLTGRYRQKVKRVTGTLTDARKVRDQLIKERDSGLAYNADAVTFSEFAREWHKRRLDANELEKRTLKQAGYHVERFCSVFGNTKLKDITPGMVEDAYSQIKANPHRGKEPLSGTTMHGLHVTLNQIMKAAVNRDLILRNPCDRIKAPKTDTQEKHFLTADQAARFVSCLNTDEAQAYSSLLDKEGRNRETQRALVRGLIDISRLMALRLCAASGVRISEALALCWGNVSNDCCAIKITQAMDVDRTTKSPKSKAGIRTISLDTSTAKHLKTWRKVQTDALKTIGADKPESIPVCSTDNGQHIDYANFSHWFVSWRNSKGFPDLKPHELRHTHATLLIGNGADIKTAQRRLGHAKASTTIDLYAHALPQNDEAAADLFGELVSKRVDQARIISLKTA